MRDTLLRTSFALLTVFTMACAPKPAEQPAPSPQTTATPETPAATAGADEPENAGTCAVDADCVPASCCHPASCVPANAKPSCDGIMCTMNCQAGTMDCGGRCACEAGSCKAIMGQS